MPYGTYRRTRPTVRPRRRAPVRRKYPIRKTGTLRTLKRQVAANRRLAQGHLQRNLQKNSANLTPTASYPIAFQVANFGQGSNSAFFQVSTSGSVGSVATWAAYDAVSNGFWANQNVDIPDTGQYRALYTNLKFRIKGHPNLDSTRVRIHILQPKTAALRFVTGSTQPLVLPLALSALSGLCDHNMINPTYFKVIATKSVLMNSAIQYDNNSADPQQLSNSTTANEKNLYFRISINRTMYQSLSGTNFGPYNTSYGNQVWAIISTDDAISSVGDAIHVDVTRQVVWRDMKGGANL